MKNVPSLPPVYLFKKKQNFQRKYHGNFQFNSMEVMMKKKKQHRVSVKSFDRLSLVCESSRLPYIIEFNYLGTIHRNQQRERNAAAGSSLTVLKYKLGSRLPVRYTRASSLSTMTISADRYSERSSSFYYINRLADNTLKNVRRDRTQLHFDSHPMIIMQVVNIFSLSVSAATLPKPTLVMQVIVK